MAESKREFLEACLRLWEQTQHAVNPSARAMEEHQSRERETYLFEEGHPDDDYLTAGHAQEIEQATRAKALDLLLPYAQHKPGCYSERQFERDCDCGLYAVKQERALAQKREG
jgi:hypothetical protein